MTLPSLNWHQVSAYMLETDDGRYRVRKSYDQASESWRYAAYQCGPQHMERLLRTHESAAEAQACCAFHAFPSETHWPEQEPTR